MGRAFWKLVDGEVVVQVRARPGARRAGIGKVRETAAGPALEVAVSEAAERGRANAAIIAAMARALGLPKSAIAMQRGATARLKVLRISDSDEEVLRRLQRLARGEQG